MTKKDILAVKNGRYQWFTRRSWDLLGNNKLGWEEVRPEPPMPKEVLSPIREMIEVSVDPHDSKPDAFVVSSKINLPEQMMQNTGGGILAFSENQPSKRGRKKK